jgi:hypothetical protein
MKHLFVTCLFIAFLSTLFTFFQVFDHVRPGVYLEHVPSEQEASVFSDGNSSKCNWIPYTAEQLYRLERTRQCVMKLPNHKGYKPVDKTITSLQCKQRISPKKLSHIVQQHDRIWFIGDSVMRQQYHSLLCMLPRRKSSDPILLPLDNDDRDMVAAFPYKPDLGLGLRFENISENESDIAHIHNTTIIRYSRFGKQFGDYRSILYSTFPNAVQTSSAKDAIVMNAGLHYDIKFAQQLVDDVTFIANASLYSQAVIYFMETTDEQWPTSNGMFARPCMWKCHCEPLTLDRIKGLGVARDKGPQNVMFSLNDREMPSKEHFDGLYSDYLKNFSSFPQAENASVEQCVPNCAPASWRSDLTNPILGNRLLSHVQLVPVWSQLVNRGLVHATADGDCTHKSLDALQMMNEQLARSMYSTMSQRNDAFPKAKSHAAGKKDVIS